eukprot:TRINITY_DN9937_c0_g1_i1.p1 TRINITY_DN9937_c0_g1~~TRINITY_DN9937_c0_g1_i1.p1  ORF type:complete len:182 (-),score=26.76 TRINITY_DN9937_c0_g1_i1:205-750(-)
MANSWMTMFLLFAGVAVVCAQDCYTYHSCGNCVAQDYCGWCESASACWPGNGTGPTNPAQTCASGAWNYQECNSKKLREGVPFKQNDGEQGFYNYYMYNVEDTENDIQVDIFPDMANTEVIYAAQAYVNPRSNRYQWKSYQLNSIVRLSLNITQLKQGPLYMNVYNGNSWGYKIVVYQPPN